MNDKNKIQERLSQLGAQFLQRTAGEMEKLHEFVGRVRGGAGVEAGARRHRDRAGK